jgi:hypothetical protein
MSGEGGITTTLTQHATSARNGTTVSVFLAATPQYDAHASISVAIGGEPIGRSYERSRRMFLRRSFASRMV